MGEFISAIGNPWLAAEFNVTRQGEFLKRYGARRAEQFKSLAQAANALAPKTQYRTTIIVRKIGNTSGGGGGLIGAGSSGDGPPEG